MLGVEPPTKFSKGRVGGRGGHFERGSVAIFTKYFSVITKNSNWESLTKNLVSFKR